LRDGDPQSRPLHFVFDAFPRSEGGARLNARVRVIGVGQRERGDDAVGLEVAARLRADAGDVVEVVSGAADAAALLAQLDGVSAAIAIDCARGGGSPGTILRLGADVASWPQSRSMSSHGNALADALALGAVLGCLPPRVTVFAVVGEAFRVGAPLSPAVRLAVPAVVAQVLREVTSLARA
jgi:hydrogenase maturation protease